MFLVLNNAAPSLSAFYIGNIIEAKDIGNEYIIKCTNSVIELPKLEFTGKLYKSITNFRFICNDKHYFMPIDIEIDFAIVEYFELDKENFILLKKLRPCITEITENSPEEPNKEPDQENSEELEEPEENQAEIIAEKGKKGRKKKI